jgi:DNA-binding LacI/PurR family transcriptional regulator
MASIKDVARLAGVSVTTVSRVINERDEVEDRTRARVQDAINKLEYKPNLVAKGLRGNRGNVIGLVVPEVMDHAFTSIVNFTIEAAHDKGFNIILGGTHNDPEVEARFIGDLIRRNVNGIIFSRVSDESRVLHIMGKTQIPIVIIDRTLEKEGIQSVVLDNYKAGRLAAEHLIQLGHRGVTCVTGPLNIALCRERLRGFRDALQAGGIDLDTECMYEGNFKFSAGKDAVRFFLRKGCGASAIWAHNDMMAFGVLKELIESGKRVPEEISVIGMDNLSFCEMVTPSMTSIHYPFDEMCTKAVETIIALNEKKQTGGTMVVLEPSLVKRDSTAPRP